MLELYLIRHGESVDNKSGLISGSSLTVPLSQKGKEQATLLGKRLAREGVVFNNIYSSPAIRAKETAELAIKEMGKSVDGIIIRDDFRELSQGDWEGKPTSYWTPELLSQIDANPMDYKTPNGESKREVTGRFYGWIEKNLMSSDAGPTAIFAHSLAIKCAIMGMLKISPNLADRLVIENTSINKLRYNKRGWYLVKLNDTGHLIPT